MRTAGDADVFAKQGHALVMLSCFVAAFRAGCNDLASHYNKKYTHQVAPDVELLTRLREELLSILGQDTEFPQFSSAC